MKKYRSMHQELRITANDSGQRLDRFLRKRFSNLPLTLIYKFLRQKKVRLIRGGTRIHGKKEMLLRRDDTLQLYFDAVPVDRNPSKKRNFHDLIKSKFFRENFFLHFEDEYLCIAEKNAGISVHPGSKTPFGRSLIELTTAYILSRNRDAPAPKLAHRLDKETSGLVLLSKNDGTLRKLTKLFREGRIEKRYLTFVRGRMKQEAGKIEGKLLRTEGSKQTKIRVSESEGAKHSETLYTVQKYFPKLDASLVEVTLLTGRMHQIRVHFAATGHPVAGDSSYGDFEWNRELGQKYGLRRHFLHAYRLGFKHPETGEKMCFVSELPKELRLFITK